MPPISTLLVANRGEIAVRVIRSARAAGIRTVAVYSDADRDAAHVLAADVAVRIGPTPARESYLNIEAVLDASRRTGADAVHPGYGFLSEAAPFARAVVGAGLTFVGPPAEVIEQMGRKDLARALAASVGVPVVPGFRLPGDVVGTGSVPDTVRPEFPVLVKAAAGGGGKGMRVVRDPGDLGQAIAAARREAQSAFGDDTILLERYVEHGRHVEVQVLADRHGNVVHLFERDCSAQRRHQKVLEEAPAPTVSEATRAVLLGSAVALARKVGYENAGTVEFLVSGDEVYFLEMNTRLQVEHPVTEMVVRVAGRRLDLVGLQLDVAAGEPLPFTQEEVRCAGHAMEARVYAEDAFNGFLPQAGTARVVRWSSRARVDAALSSGAEVGTAYDPMLGKVIVHGPTREAARRALVTALDDTAILGLTTNLGFLRALAASKAFTDHAVDTAWLDRNPDAIRPPDSSTAAVAAAWVLARTEAVAGVAQQGVAHQLRAVGDTGPFGSRDGWRLGGPPAPVTVELVVDAETGAGTRVFAVSEEAVDSHRVRPVATESGVHRLEIDGLVHEATVLVEPHQIQVSHHGHTFVFPRPDAFGPGSRTDLVDGTVIAPMPGTVLAVQVEEGEQVVEGQVLGVLEAMKMEVSLRAPCTGTVTTVATTAGAQVALGAELFRVEPAAEEPEERRSLEQGKEAS